MNVDMGVLRVAVSSQLQLHVPIAKPNLRLSLKAILSND